MKILHLNAGNETGGGMFHILSLLNKLNKEEFVLGVFEEGKLVNEANKLGIKTALFPQRGRCDLTVVKQIVDFVRQHDIDIIHTHGPRANLIGSIVRLFISCKLVVTVHSDPRSDFLGRGVIGQTYSLLNILSIRQADYIFAISERFKEILVNLKVDKNKINTIFNGIDFNKALKPPYKREDFHIAKNEFVIMMIARLEAIKGHELAIEAFKKVVACNPSSRLILIGDGSLETELKKKTIEQGLQNHVNFFGYREDVEQIIPIADVLLLTSYSESFPLVILEAARAKIPVISTDVGGVKKLITDRSLGWVVPVGESEAIFSALTEAISYKKEGKLTEIGEKLYQKASQNYSIQQFINSVYFTYKQFLGIL